ncbi:MAG: hypothetical protein LBB55_02670, partial [Zoogloeaceae bacterium]|nr:hypothetical protein [Zoogloeaceae bacterium]
MFRKTTTTALALAALFVGLSASPAYAQFGDLADKVTGGKKEKSSENTSASNVKISSDLVKHFVAAQKLVLDAQISFAKSFDLADQVQLLEAEKKAISSGSVDKSVLEKSVTISDRANKAIEEKIKAQPALNASSKAQ